MKCGKYNLELDKRTYVMGILNITPDSFSDGDKFTNIEKAVEHAKQMISSGADIIDIGAESTRPGTEETPAKVELKRMIPVLKRILEETEIPISIDTSKSEVAKIALDMGAHIINDVAFKSDTKMASVVAKYDVPIILMHIKGTPKNMQIKPQYKDIIEEIKIYLKECIEIVKNEGVKNDKIIIDPGIGFGKTTSHNLEILNRLKEFKTLGYPILIGTSRKSFIGKILGPDSKSRLEGTIASNVISIMNGANIIRVHDVEPCVRASRVTDAILRGVKNI